MEAWALRKPEACMSFELKSFADVGLSGSELRGLLSRHASDVEPRHERLWTYYRNEVRLPGSVVGAGGATTVRHGSAQELGLPARLRSEGARSAGVETVIENDIGWRVDSIVDFVFGKPVSMRSLASDESKRRGIERVLDEVWESSGGSALLQDVGTLGSVHGFVDLLVRTEGLLSTDAGRSAARRAGAAWSGWLRGGGVGEVPEAVLEAARLIRIDVVPPSRAVPVLDGRDVQRLRAYAIRTRIDGSAGEDAVVSGGIGGVAAKWLGRGGGKRGAHGTELVEVISATAREVYEDGELVGAEELALGELPVVHIQNLSQPLRYEGRSDVEPLIPLQDELNTRLSDRAHRVSMQSFKMYLAKGIEGFADVPVRPGQVWSTDNPDAEVRAFGGDGHSPSEDAHLGDIRDAMDKASGISPVVLGLLRARIGHLSSENALRVTLMGVLAKTARKRLTYGRGMVRASELVLRALDVSGAMPTGVGERGLRLWWPDPLPADRAAELASAEKKVELGVERERVLGEIGYGDRDAGIV